MSLDIFRTWDMDYPLGCATCPTVIPRSGLYYPLQRDLKTVEPLCMRCAEPLFPVVRRSQPVIALGSNPMTPTSASETFLPSRSPSRGTPSDYESDRLQGKRYPLTMRGDPKAYSGKLGSPLALAMTPLRNNTIYKKVVVDQMVKELGLQNYMRECRRGSRKEETIA